LVETARTGSSILDLTSTIPTLMPGLCRLTPQGGFLIGDKGEYQTGGNKLVNN
jgi:hypothetical protein